MDVSVHDFESGVRAHKHTQIHARTHTIIDPET